jgi:hypothetical protein
MATSGTRLAIPSVPGGQVAGIDALAAVPEEEIWLASQKSARTRRAYKQDVAHFMGTLASRRRSSCARSIIAR